MLSKPIIASILISASLLLTAFTFKDESRYILDNISYYSLSEPAKKQVECLAENIYFEAAHEPHDGKLAVAMVTMNRVSTGNYASDICGVVKQKTGHTCQFSWWCDTKFTSKRLTIKQSSLYNEIRDLAVYVVMNYENIKDVTYGATYYHADYVNPAWGLPKTTKIGRHIFYKKKSDSFNPKEFKI
jgi:spore germination cell wall hydrolase CwlJ-like protein